MSEPDLGHGVSNSKSFVQAALAVVSIKKYNCKCSDTVHMKQLRKECRNREVMLRINETKIQ